MTDQEDLMDGCNGFYIKTTQPESNWNGGIGMGKDKQVYKVGFHCTICGETYPLAYWEFNVTPSGGLVCKMCLILIDKDSSNP